MGPTQTQKICTVKETINKTKKTTHKLGENICQFMWPIRDYSPKFTNSSRHLTASKTNNPIKKKKSTSPKQTFLLRRHTNDQEAHEKMFDINDY